MVRVFCNIFDSVSKASKTKILTITHLRVHLFSFLNFKKHLISPFLKLVLKEIPKTVAVTAKKLLFFFYFDERPY